MKLDDINISWRVESQVRQERIADRELSDVVHSVTLRSVPGMGIWPHLQLEVGVGRKTIRVQDLDNVTDA